jgi:MoaA/NifB/PqqE/SkfB family radical SAM enzyme
MSKLMDNLLVARAILSNPQIIKARPSINWFLLKYLSKFKIQNVDGNLIIHSHLPPLNSTPYTRFINEHLLSKTSGPSHAQIGLTNLCPQKCEYCYNRERTGQVMDTDTIMRVIRDLKKMGVFWLGFTGGEPLLNKDIAKIVGEASNDCAVKLFTTGCNLNKSIASDLKKAGLFSVSISLDHWQENIHDGIRGYQGAFKTALEAIDTFKNLGGVHVSISAVISRGMIKANQVEEFIRFLDKLEIDEAWLSETKPSVQAYWNPDLIITDSERQSLIDLQDRYNKTGKMTINYLGHFESAVHFGCSAGHKMVYIDSFGEVSPCVFIPVTFGNVRMKSIEKIWGEMKPHFPTERRCFINKNYPLLEKHFIGKFPIDEDETLKMMKEVEFDPMPEFYRLYYR